MTCTSRNYQLRAIADSAAWKRLLTDICQPHLMQSWAYGMAKQLAANWHVRRFTIEKAGTVVAICQVLEKRIASPADASGYPPDLDVLWQGVADITKPDNSKIYFLRRLPRDPFFPDSSAEPAATWGKRSYASPPDDPQEGEDVYDVYSLSAKTGLNGVPYREW